MAYIIIDGPRRPSIHGIMVVGLGRVICGVRSPDGVFGCTQEATTHHQKIHTAHDGQGNVRAEWLGSDGPGTVADLFHWDSHGMLIRGPHPSAPAIGGLNSSIIWRSPTTPPPLIQYGGTITLADPAPAPALTPKIVKETNAEVDDVDCLADDYDPARDGALPTWRYL